MNKNKSTAKPLSQLQEGADQSIHTLTEQHLAFEYSEKEKRAAELIIANRKLAFENKEKEKRATELIIANSELAFQNEEKEKRAAELVMANKELAYQNAEKEKRAAELIEANAELLFQNGEKEKRAAELIFANSELKNAQDHIRKLNEEERIKTGEELKRLNYRLQLAVKSADLGIWDWDIVKNTLKWDDAMFKLYRIEDDGIESQYQFWISKIHPDDKDRVNAEIQLALDGQKKYDTEFRITDRLDGIYTLRATGIVERNTRGTPVRMIGINWDITKRKAEAQERDKIIEEMSRRNAELEQFSYIISHNLRAPVANIMGASNVITDPDLSEEDRLIFNKGIREAAISLDNTIKDLNHILEIKTGHYEKEMVRFSDLTAAIQLTIGNLLLANDFTITVDFSAIDELFTIRPYLHSIFYNLISNSIKYRRKDVNSRLEIKSEQSAGKTILLFADNGIGLNLVKNSEHIFGLYKRFHLDIPGKGMGLFMVRSQVEILGGRVSVESLENEGTSFRIEFE